MRKTYWRVSLTLFALCLFSEAGAPADTYAASLAGGGAGKLGIVSGSVRDNKGNPLAGALVQLLRDGADHVTKQTRTAADGTFTARIVPGRYLLKALAEGFNATTFNAVQVNPSDELVYRFNLEPLGQGRTMPETRNDRNDTKWRLRSSQNRRSIFQNNDGEDKTIAAVEESIEAGEEAASADEAGDWTNDGRSAQGVIESFTAASANPNAPVYAGTNFAVSVPANEGLNLIFAGQLATNGYARLETTGRFRAGAQHLFSATIGGATLPLAPNSAASSAASEDDAPSALKQVSLRATDEWVVREGVVVVLGLDYSRFTGAHGSGVFSPRLGFQFDADARTRFRFGYAPGGTNSQPQSVARFEDGAIVFPEMSEQPVAFVDGRAVMERSRRLEFGVERVLDNNSSIEATAFFDTTDGRGVGLMNLPLNDFSNERGTELLSVANQQGAARGLRVVYARRLGSFLKTSAGYAFGRGQQLAAGFSAANSGASPNDLFRDGFFQTVAAQVESSFDTGTEVRTVVRFSPRAAVFAIDPFAGRVAVFDPSLSILVTQDLPTFGLPLRAEAVLDARNLLDAQTAVDDGETLTSLSTNRRSVRGGISVRF
ncbi:MAG TPA: carboxypeptidase-like regulatory domain-containing protein [Pyrinomonadaceae bacterium]|nr:carboxypeptidase-like regulatory domain-containing protein [Pyrinomonadaceae bacterium]